jgi:aminopeptidase
MLSEKMLESYAEVMIWGLTTARKKKYRKGEIVRISFDLPAMRLAEILQKILIERGVNPVLRSGLTPTMEKNFFFFLYKSYLFFFSFFDR